MAPVTEVAALSGTTVVSVLAPVSVADVETLVQLAARRRSDPDSGAASRVGSGQLDDQVVVLVVGAPSACRLVTLAKPSPNAAMSVFGSVAVDEQSTAPTVAPSRLAAGGTCSTPRRVPALQVGHVDVQHDDRSVAAGQLVAVGRDPSGHDLGAAGVVGRRAETLARGDGGDPDRRGLLGGTDRARHRGEGSEVGALVHARHDEVGRLRPGPSSSAYTTASAGNPSTAIAGKPFSVC